jgi:hypothetical protein
MNRSLMLLVNVSVLATACDDAPNISGLPGYAISSVRIVPSVDTIFVAGTFLETDRVQFTALAESRTGALLDGLRYVWSTSDPGIATIDSAGVATARAHGTVEITASAYKVGHATLFILPAANVVVIRPTVDTVLVHDPVTPARDTTRLRATAYDGAGQVIAGAAFTWTSSSAAVEVDAEGLARGVLAGKATISAAAEGLSGSSTVIALEAIASVTLLPAPDTLFVGDPIVAGDTLRLTPRSLDPFGGELTSVEYTWSSSAPAVATVEAYGLVRATGPGSTTITVQAGTRSAQHRVHVVLAAGGGGR